VFNADGQTKTVKYRLLPTFLLSAWQRQHRIIEEQAERIQAQAKQIAALERRLGMIEALLRRPDRRQAAAQAAD
jgi:hypothetical protein